MTARKTYPDICPYCGIKKEGYDGSWGHHIGGHERQENLGPERRKAAKKKAEATLGAEGRSAAIRKGKANMGAERRRQAAIKAQETKGEEGRRAAARKAVETIGPQRRSEIMKRAAKNRKPRSAESRKKQGERMKGEGNPFYGKKHTKAAKQKIREKATGRPVGEAARKKLSDRFSGEGNPFHGKKHNAKSLEKMSASKKGNKNCVGRQISEETRRKIGKANKGKKRTEAVKRQMSKSRRGLLVGEKNPMYGKTREKNPMYGKPRTEADKKKMRDAKRERGNSGADIRCEFGGCYIFPHKKGVMFGMVWDHPQHGVEGALAKRERAYSHGRTGKLHEPAKGDFEGFHKTWVVDWPGKRERLFRQKCKELGYKVSSELVFGISIKEATAVMDSVCRRGALKMTLVQHPAESYSG